MCLIGKAIAFLTTSINTKVCSIFRIGLPNPRLAFDFEHDTVFFRPVSSSFLIQDNPSLLVNFIRASHSIVQHIAFPICLKRELHVRDLRATLSAFIGLKSLTLMLGCEEKSWRGDSSIELRDLREWFADGRSRTIIVEDPTTFHKKHCPQCRQLCDITDLAQLIAQRLRPRDIAVRIVAWKRRTWELATVLLELTCRDREMVLWLTWNQLVWASVVNGDFELTPSYLFSSTFSSKLLSSQSSLDEDPLLYCLRGNVKGWESCLHSEEES